VKAGWQTKTLGEILERTETFDPTRTPTAEFEYIDVSSVSNQTLTIQDTQSLIGKNAPSRARRLVKANDVLFATIRPTLRRIAIVPETLDRQICSTGYFVLRAKPEADHRYLFYFLQTAGFMTAMEKLQKGASYPAVTDSDVRSQPIPVPPLPDQHRIVAILDEAFAGIATARANAEQNLRNARALFESQLQAVFSQRGEGWVEKRLSDVSEDFGRGKSKHRPRNDPKLYGGEYPFIQTGDVRNCEHVITTYSQTYNETGLAQSKLWPRGTLCITIAANIAETGILDFDACFPDSVIGVIANKSITTTKYLEYLLHSFKAHLQAQGKGSAQDNINLGTFENQYFPFADLEKQNEIISTLDGIRKETQHLESLCQRKLAALDELKQSLLHRAFSGNL